MSQIAIKVSNLTKIFKIYDRPKYRLKELLFLGRKQLHSEFRALSNINFEIEKGDFVGVVGRNGAGKSTLLKILSGELTPTIGQVEIKGTVSLLQLGAGFDPELTGAENARFSCRLLGLDSQQIETTLKEIEFFADIGEFFQHPVKTYSTGMHSRLSFACAVNIDPDILIVDEVLSVGDAQFSQKCLRKMHSFKEQGKTIIFVTHSTQQLGVFCNKVMWVMDGKIYQYGPAKEISEAYKNYMTWGKLPNEVDTSSPEFLASAGWISTDSAPQVGGEKVKIKRVRVLNDENASNVPMEPNTQMSIEIEIEALEDLESLSYGMIFNDENGVIAFHTNSDLADFQSGPINKGKLLAVSHQIKLPLLNSGNFYLSISAGEGSTMDHRVHDLIQIEVDASKMKKRFGYLQIEEEQARVIV